LLLTHDKEEKEMAAYDTLLVKIDKRSGGSRYRLYNVKQRICDSALEVFDFPLDIVALRYSKVGYLGHELLIKLNDVEGIERIDISPYCLCIEKNIVFNWEDLEADILFAIETVVKKPVVLKD